MWIHFSFRSSSRLSGRFNLVLLYIWAVSISPIDAWKGGVPSSAVAREGYRGHTHEKKRTAGGGSTCEHQKGGKKIFRRERKARERKKNIIRAGAKKKLFGRERKKIRTSTRTQPTKKLTYSRDVFFLPIPLRSRYLLEGAATKFFFETECKRQKYFLKVNAKRPKIHDDWQVTVW